MWRTHAFPKRMIYKYWVFRCQVWLKFAEWLCCNGDDPTAYHWPIEGYPIGGYWYDQYFFNMSEICYPLVATNIRSPTSHLMSQVGGLSPTAIIDCLYASWLNSHWEYDPIDNTYISGMDWNISKDIATMNWLMVILYTGWNIPVHPRKPCTGSEGFRKPVEVAFNHKDRPGF